MATDSPRRVNRISGNVVRSEPVSDKSVMESVVGFLQDFTLTKTPEDKEKVIWLQFEQPPSTDFLRLCRPSTYSALPHSHHPPLLLTIGYTNGIQIWLLLEDGEAQEVMSLRQGPIRHFRFLVTPFNAASKDLHSTKRPLIALTEDPSLPHSYTSVRIMSLRHGSEVDSIDCQSPVLDILSNDRVLVVTVVERILVYDALTLKERFIITNCYPSPGINPNPVSLGSRWIAYADKNLSRAHQSCGGFCRDDVQSYAATFIHVAKTFKKGISALGETLANSVANQGNVGHRGSPVNHSAPSFTTPGVVSIIDTHAVVDPEVAVSDYWEMRGLVAHFTAHQHHPLSSLTFDPSGSLLLTTDLLGRSFHLYRILPHHSDSTLTTIHHIYILHRGETTSKVQSTCFTWDSRWVAVTTFHGTTHLFPVTCYGGPVNKRTHVSRRVVSRVSRFETSAGLTDATQHLKKAPTHAAPAPPPTSVSSSCPPPSFIPPSGPPFTPSNAPAHTKTLDKRSNEQLQLHKQQQQQRLLQHTINPRLPPFPQPTTIHPLAQIRQSYSSVPSTDHGAGSSLPPCTNQSNSTRSIPEPRFISTVFAASRCKGSPIITDRSANGHNRLDSLFIATSSGIVTEHILKVQARSNEGDKVTEDSPIQVECVPKLCWNLIRCHSMKELKLPLSPTNPILSSFDTQVQHHRQQHPPHPHHHHHQQDLLQFEADDSYDEEWLSQVEIVTHAAPHRRLWMGPQFTFKPLNGDKGVVVTLSSTSSTSSSSSSLTSLSSTSFKQTEDVFDAKYLSTTCGKSKPVKIKVGGGGAGRGRKQPATLIEACHSGSFSAQSSLDARWFDPVPYKYSANQEQDQKVKDNLADAILDETWPSEGGGATIDQSECTDSWAGCLGYEGGKNASKS